MLRPTRRAVNARSLPIVGRLVTILGRSWRERTGQSHARALVSAWPGPCSQPAAWKPDNAAAHPTPQPVPAAPAPRAEHPEGNQANAPAERTLEPVSPGPRGSGRAAVVSAATPSI